MNSFTTFITQLFIISLVAVFTLSCKQPASEKSKNNTMKIEQHYPE
jgi:N-acetylneuraminate epimerase